MIRVFCDRCEQEVDPKNAWALGKNGTTTVRQLCSVCVETFFKTALVVAG
jgi:hypothetical protein